MFGLLPARPLPFALQSYNTLFPFVKYFFYFILQLSEMQSVSHVNLESF